MKKNHLFSFLFLFLFSFSAFAVDKIKSFEMIDMPLDEVARVVSDRIGYNMVFSSYLKNHMINHVQGGELIETEFLDLLRASLRLSGFDYQLKDKTIFVHPLDTSNLFPVKPSYKIFNLPYSGIDLKPFISQIGIYVQSGLVAFIYDDVDVLLRVEAFIEHLPKPDELVFKSYSYNHLSDDFINYLKMINVAFINDDKTKQLLINASLKHHKNIDFVLSSTNREYKTYNLELLVMSLNLEYLTNRGFGFIFSEGGFSLDLFSSFSGFNSLGAGKQSLSVFASFLSSESDSVLYSKPFLQLRPSETVSFSVGKEVPFLTSVVDSATGQTIRNIDRKNVGLTVNATLLFDTENYLLELHQVLSNLTETNVGQSQDVIIDKQELSTRLSVKPGLVYSVGGLNDYKRNKLDSAPFKFLRGLNSSDTEKYHDLVIFVLLKPVASINSLPSIPKSKLSTDFNYSHDAFWYLHD